MADPGGAPLAGAAGQRRVLAFLSVLATAGDGGLSRDKIAALLWPEADTDRARHSVTQALYAARKALGIDDLFDAGSDVRLNRSQLASDVQEFEAALAAGDLERAVALYQGPFLDGFFLPGSPEFEQWSSAQRERLEDRMVGALEQLAVRAESAGSVRDALEWRKRLAGLRPLDSALAVKLMTAQARAGDRAGAIRHAEVHAILLREELGLEPDAAVSALVTRLRDPAAWPDAAGVDLEVGALGRPLREREEPRPAPVSAVSPVDVPSQIEPSVEAEPQAAPTSTARERAYVAWSVLRARLRDRRVAGGVAALLVLVVALGIWAARREAPSAPPTAEARHRQTVVVAPFRVAGASETLGYLRDGLVELLSARLADDSAARSVDAGAVLSAWRKAGIARDVDLPRDTVVRIAASLGAERVVIGSVVGTRSHAIFTAVVVMVSSGAVAGSATVEGPADSVTTLVDRLAARLLVQAAGEDGALAGQTTESLPALRSFLQGQAAFRRNGYDDALRAYERALQHDSTFALAALQMVRSADRLQSVEDRSWALALAWRARGALSERDHALLLALTGPRFPSASTAAEQLAAWERPARLTPERAESWYELGAPLFHAGAVIGLPSARARAASTLRRALQVDSAYAPARRMLAHLAAGNPPEPAAGALPSAVALHDSTGPLAPFIQWRVAVARGDTVTRRRMRDTMPRLGRANLRAIALAGQFDGVALPDARRAIGILRERAARNVDRLEAAEATHSLALNEGRIRDAERALEQMGDLQPGSHAQLRLRVMDALYGDADRSAAERAALALERAVGQGQPVQPALRAEQEADACVLAQWRLARGDTAGVAAIMTGLRDATTFPSARLAATPAGLCATLLDAALAVTVGRPDAGALLAHLDSLAFTLATSGDATSYAPILIGRLHERLGNAPAALAAVRRRTYMVGWPRYLSTAWRDEGRHAANAGDSAIASAAYQRYLELRAEPDPALAADVQRVRQALAELAPPAR